MSNIFKAGDKVYYPAQDSTVHVVRDNDCEVYPLRASESTFTTDGRVFKTSTHQSIFHATKENQALLEALYGVSFDDPPLSDAERIIKALENSGGKPVLCWCKSSSRGYWFIQAIESYSEQRGFKAAHNIPVYKGYDEVKPASQDDFVLV